MKYRDVEVYLNNPTLSEENEGNYQQSSIFQLGLLTSLPPAAMWIIQKARAADKRRNTIYRIRNYERNVRRGTHFSKNFKAQSIINEAKINEEYYEYTRRLEELRAQESSPDANYEQIAKERDEIETRVRTLVQDINEKPYTVYRNREDMRIAQFRESFTRDQEWEWLRSSEAGESFQESINRLEGIRVIAEQRHVIEPSKNRLKLESLTTSGQNAFKMLAKFLKDSFGVNTDNISNNPEEFEHIKVYKGSPGTYRYEISLPGNYGGGRFEVELPAFHGDDQILKEAGFQTQGRSFDGRLMSSFAAQNTYRIDGQTRVPKFKYRVEGKKNIISLPSQVMFGENGRFSGTLNTINSQVQKIMRGGNPDGILIMNTIISGIKNANYDKEVFEVVEKGYEQELMPGALILERHQIKVEDSKKAAELSYVQRNKKSDLGKAGSKEIKKTITEFNLKSIASITENPIFVSVGGEEIQVTGLNPRATLSSSSGIAESGKVIAVPSGYAFAGGHRQGQQALRTNLALGFSIDNVIKRGSRRIYFDERRALADRVKRLRMRLSSAKERVEATSVDQEARFNPRYESMKKRKARIRNFLSTYRTDFGFERYDIANQKWKATLKGTPLEGEDASFRVRRALITLGDDLSNPFGTTRDQSITIGRYGVNFSDIYNNPNVDLIQVTNSVAYVTDHVVTFDNTSKQAVSNRVVRGSENSIKYISAKESKNGARIFKSVTAKLKEAEKRGSPMILVTKEEAQALDIPVTEGMRVKQLRGSSTELKTPHYVVLFERRFTGNNGVTQYRFAGEYNTKNILGNVTKESSKTTNQVIAPMRAAEMIEHAFSGRPTSDPDVQLARAAAKVIQKGFIDQIASGDFLVGKGYNLQLTEGIYRRLLSQLATNELNETKDLPSYVRRNMKGQFGSLDSRQSLIQINGKRASGSGFYEAAEDLFSRIILGRDRVAGERHIASLVVSRVNSTGEVTVSFKLTPKGLEHWRHTKATTSFLQMIRDKDVQAMKLVNQDLNKIISARLGSSAAERNKDLFFGYVDEKSPGSEYVSKVVNMVKGDGSSGTSKSMFLDIMFGQGIAQGHDFYPNYARPQYGTNFYEGGPTFNFIEISGMTHINRAMAAQMSNMLSMSIERSYLSRSAALAFNKSINNATKANQNEDAKRLVRAARKNYRESMALLDEVTYMTRDAFLTGDTAVDAALGSERIKKRRVGDLTITEVLEKYKQIGKGGDTGSRADALIRALGFDNFYIDQEDEIRLKSLYTKKEKVMQEVIPGSGLRVSGLELAQEIRLQPFQESFVGNPKTDMLFVNIPKPEEIGKKVTSSEIAKIGENLVGEAKAKATERQMRILKAIQRDGIINVKHMVGGAQKHLQIELLNKVSWMIKNAGAEFSEKHRSELKEIFELLHVSVERVANDMIREEAEQVGFGKKTQEMLKITPAYSASLNLSRYDPLQSAWSKIAEQRGHAGQELEWNAVVINKKQATYLANSKMVSANRALQLVSNASSNKIGVSLMAAEMQDISKDLGFVDSENSPIGVLVKDFEGIHDTEEQLRKGKYSKTNRRVRAQLNRLSRTVQKLQELGFNSWESVNEATQNKSAAGLEGIRKLFSKEGFYKRIETRISKGRYQLDVINAWKSINEALQEIGMLRKNKKGEFNIGRLYRAWKSIGERLNQKNTWSIIDSALKNAISNSSGEEAENIRLLRQSLESALEDQREFERREQKIRASNKGSGPKSVKQGIAVLHKEFEERLGKNFHLIELMQRANIDANSLNSYLKANKAAPSQLASFEATVQKRKAKIARDFVGFELLANRLQSLVSFNNEEELLRLKGMSDQEIKQLAKNKTRSLIKQSIEIANQVKNSSADKELKDKFRRRIIDFVREIKGVRGERGLREELTEAFKFFKGILGEGLTSTEGVDPNIMADKHMKQVILRSVLDKELVSLEKAGHIKDSSHLISYLRQDSIKVGALFQSILDRDLDGDRLKLMANIIDRRWASPKESIVTSNVLGFMYDSSFTYSDGRLKASNIYSARNIEWITNEKFAAKEIVLERVEDYVRKALKREMVQHGEMEFRPGESATAYLDRKQKEILDKWIEQNHGRGLKGKEREKVLAESYILTKADTVTTGPVKDPGSSLSVIFVKGGERVATSISKQDLKSSYTQGYVIDLLNRLGGGVKSVSDETFLDRNYNFVPGKDGKPGVDLKDSASQVLKKFSQVSAELVNSGAKQLLDEANQIKGLNAKVFMTQKSTTGELYKFPMMMRAFGAALAENNVGKLGQMGKAMSEVASYAGYMFEQHIAIGIKKGGQDAGEGVKNLYQKLSVIASEQDDVNREIKIKNLYEELTTKGLDATPTVTEAAQLQKTKFAEKILRKQSDKFGTLELLAFGQAKQKAIEDILNGKRGSESDQVVKFLMDRFPDSKISKEDAVKVSRSLKLEVVREARALRDRANLEAQKIGKGSGLVTGQGTLVYMLENLSKLNADTAAMNQTYLNFGKFGVTSSVNLIKAAKDSGFMQEYKKITAIMGDVSKDATERDFIMDLVTKMDKEGVAATSFGRSFIEEIGNNSALGKMDLEYIKSVIRGRKGKETRIGFERKINELFSKNAYRNGAIAALGILAIGALAPDVSVGAGRDSYIDKRPEIESELPRKMLAQYSNQANVAYVPPWVSERIKAERREKAAYNSMFFRGLIG